ncbi:MAG: recognition motif protein [Verrucomicrobiales bacterium]|nr:recognition motif protein [Verrucomicrobiales bacterium]
MTKIYVGNLSFNTTENDLQDTFAEYGTVTAVDIITDRVTGRARGFAFVTMADDAEAQAAINALNGAKIGDRSLTVNEARPREERSFADAGSGNFRNRGTHRNY